MDLDRARTRVALAPLYLRAGLAASAVEIALRLAPLDRVARLSGMSLDVGCAGMASAPRRVNRRDKDRLRAMNAVMRRWPFPGTCLRRALVLGWLLRDKHPRLVVGVAREGTGEVVAHAWVECSAGTFGFDGWSQQLRAPVTHTRP